MAKQGASLPMSCYMLDSLWLWFGGVRLGLRVGKLVLGVLRFLHVFYVVLQTRTEGYRFKITEYHIFIFYIKCRLC
jgi:hypothetical protein